MNIWQYFHVVPSEVGSMPSRARPRSGDLAYLDDKERGLNCRRASRPHQQTRFARDSIRPPYADLPLEFMNNRSNGYVVQATYSGNQQQTDQMRKSLERDNESTKYMSEVRGYLQKAEMIQDTAPNVEVLDWGCIEKWTHAQSKCLVSNASMVDSDTVTFDSIRNKKPEINVKDKFRNIVDVDRKFSKDEEKYQNRERHDKSFMKDGIDLESPKGKQKCLNQCNDYVAEIPSSKLENEDAQPRKCSEQFQRPGFDSSSQIRSGEQESIVLLVPKDSFRPRSPDLYRKEPLNGKLTRHSLSSFSDLASVDEIHPHESFSETRHSCSQNATGNDLDMKLDYLIKSEGVNLPDKPPNTTPQPNESNMKIESSASTVSKAACGSDRTTSNSSIEMDIESSKHQWFGSRFRMTKSLSVESSNHHPLCSMNVIAKSRSALSETSKSNVSNIFARAKASPLKRLLYPLLKPKVLKRKPQISADVPELENPVAQTVKALLYLTVMSGLPLFKFVVEINNEILASTVKSLSSFSKDDSSLLYTFVSVCTITKKTSGWINRKIKPSGCEYNVIGQMKVSNSNFPTTERSKVKESVLYSTDVSKSDAATSECVTSRELAAIVVNILDETGKYDSSSARLHSDTMVILPGGEHSLPHKGVASSLVNRWRTGGLCDCGGWDEGCKLRVLVDGEENHNAPIHSRSQVGDFRCALYDQEDSKQYRAFFRLVPRRDGLFSVEFDAKMSSLQAFSICVALINSKQSG